MQVLVRRMCTACIGYGITRPVTPDKETAGPPQFDPCASWIGHAALGSTKNGPRIYDLKDRLGTTEDTPRDTVGPCGPRDEVLELPGVAHDGINDYSVVDDS